MLRFCIAAAVLLTSISANAQPTRFALELEAGPVWQSYNDVEIPNDGTATRFSLKDLAGSGPWPAGRAYLTWNINDRHGLRALAAPLTITETGTPAGPISFAGADYAAGTPTEATYKFNSWRLGYRYTFGGGGDRWTWRLGFTAKIRDAKIELRQGDVTSQKTDLGFVPLLHVSADWRFTGRWSLLLDIEALAGGPGRAEDVSLEVSRETVDRTGPWPRATAWSKAAPTSMKSTPSPGSTSPWCRRPTASDLRMAHSRLHSCPLCRDASVSRSDRVLSYVNIFC